MNMFLFSYLIQWGQVRKSALYNALWEGDSLQPLLQRAPASAWLAQHTRPITLFYPPATGWPKRVIFPCPTSLVNSLRKNSLQVSMPASQRTFMTDQRNTFLCSLGVFLSSQTFAHWWSRIARSPESWAQWNYSLLSVETRTAFGAQNPFSFTHQ